MKKRRIISIRFSVAFFFLSSVMSVGGYFLPEMLMPSQAAYAKDTSVATKKPPLVTKKAPLEKPGGEKGKQRSKREVGALLSQMKEQGYCVFRAEEHLRRSEFDLTFSALQQANLREQFPEMMRLAKAYAKLLTDHYEIQDSLRRSERALYYRSYELPTSGDTPERLSYRISETWKLLTEFNRVYDSAYRCKNEAASIRLLTDLEDRIQRAQLEIRSSVDSLWQSVAQTNYKQYDVKLPDLHRGDNDVKGLGNKLVLGFIRRAHYLPEGSFEALGFDFETVLVPVDIGLQERRDRENQLAEENPFSQIDAQIEANARRGRKSALDIELLDVAYFDEERVDGVEGINKGTGPNPWHPVVAKRIENGMIAIANHFRDNPNILFYEIQNELETTHLQGENPSKEYFGRVAKYFHQHLRQEYGSLEALNKRWNRNYRSFEEIHPAFSAKPTEIETKQPSTNKLLPPKKNAPAPVKPLKPSSKSYRISPEQYQFGNFRRTGFAEFYGQCATVIHRIDKTHPVMPQAIDSIMGASVPYLVALQEWDIISVHEPAGGPVIQGWNNLREISSLNALVNKPMANDEYIYNAPEGISIGDEVVLGAVVERNLWQQCAAGTFLFELFELSGSFPGWNNYTLEESNHEILRLSAGMLPAARKKLDSLYPIIRETTIADTAVGIIYPSTAAYIAYPYKATLQEKIAIESWLFDNNYSYSFAPEQALIDGKCRVDSYSTVFLPYMTHMTDTLAEKLLSFVYEGGAILASGPPGLFDEYGNESKFLRTIMGDFDPRFVDGDEWMWSLTPRNAGWGGNIEVLAKEMDGSASVLSAQYGKGFLAFTLMPLNESRGFLKVSKKLGATRKQSDLSALRAANFFDQLNRLTGLRDVSCDVAGLFDMIIRVDGNNKYLVVVNLDPTQSHAANITVHEPLSDVIDLSVPGCAPIPFNSGPNRTVFKTKLYPGEGTIFWLRR